jgi:hypothetical protein
MVYQRVLRGSVAPDVAKPWRPCGTRGTGGPVCGAFAARR